MIRTLDDLDAEGAALGVRVDINSPIDGDGLDDDARLRAHVETIAELCRRGARVALLAHQGRPGGEEFTDLRAHADRLDELLGFPVAYSDSTFTADARERIAGLEPGSAVLLENTRFYSEEYMSFDPEAAAETYLVERLAPALDAYVNDAFATSHRRQPSIVGFPELLDPYAGRVMERELDVLGNIAESPEPRVYVLGGAKVDDSIEVARSVLERGLADSVLTAGIVGNAFLLADGVSLGAASAGVVNERSHDAVKNAGDLLDDFSHRIYMPRDVAVERGDERCEFDLDELPSNSPAMDIGVRTVAAYAEILDDAGTAILNGPAGVFEDDRFETGTLEMYSSATRADTSIVGGGDTASALRKLDLLEGFDHVSTGGGAALRMLTGDTLAGVEALHR
ncbi:phosphoglycerate kinase [Natronomonas moolapensis 8.8.11]|uniref:Phosphoglycerate kinase n=1 Tax=Natronomonas moolapensis (strain DSM 18674 / CECT 7526 / JCM 14361 / 8.8.11) TaxID=268739 RepID=M1XQY3_NATM8|nr:phosphoglycerate kinase [Natronomonas moolapensis]CCQ36594.1 phosphoglycerate kinase [Natronomonas moolapensis 8.8.11]